MAYGIVSYGIVSYDIVSYDIVTYEKNGRAISNPKGAAIRAPITNAKILRARWPRPPQNVSSEYIKSTPNTGSLEGSICLRRSERCDDRHRVRIF